jgi:hypothetical protein
MGASSCEAGLSFITIKNCCQIMRTPFIESCENGFGGRGVVEGETVRRSNNNNNLIMSHHHHH